MSSAAMVAQLTSISTQLALTIILMAAVAQGSMSFAVTRAAPARLAAMPARPEPRDPARGAQRPTPRVEDEPGQCLTTEPGKSPKRSRQRGPRLGFHPCTEHDGVGGQMQADLGCERYGCQTQPVLAARPPSTCEPGSASPRWYMAVTPGSFPPVAARKGPRPTALSRGSRAAPRSGRGDAACTSSLTRSAGCAHA